MALPLLLVVNRSVVLDAVREGARVLRFLERPWGRIARYPAWSMVLVACVAVGASAVLSLLGTTPAPEVHDEFSNLLAADTFAHGRLTNPPHPMWVHFESMHILQQPKYASKYPPGQGMLLALGQVLTGYPIVGAWLGSGLACAALYWMLMAWLPRRWALLGALLWAANPTMLFWSLGYWGGALPVCGGALVLGAIRRLVVQPRTMYSLVLGLGMAILANSRPFEGMVLCLLGLTPLVAAFIRRKGPSLRALLGRVAVPVGIITAASIALMGYYNWRVTGSPIRMPYTLHEETYAVTPAFLWQRARPEPAYRHQAMHDFYTGWALSFYENQRSFHGLLQGAFEKITILYQGYFKLPVFVLSILGLPWVLKYRWMRWAFATFCFFVTIVLTETWMQWHYVAPALGLLLILVVQGLRQVRVWRWNDRPVGLFLVRAMLAVSLIVVALSSLTLYQAKNSGWKATRAQILNELAQVGGKHLVIVRYRPEHDVHHEWVYNEADIDDAAVVWAREMAPAQNLALLQYFSDRRVWLLEADAKEEQLEPYLPPAEPRQGQANLSATGLVHSP